MKIIPVLDILEGVVVRGIAGRRDEYRPIVSRLTSSANPVDVARAIRDAFDLNQIYVADLDGILRQRPNRHLYQSLLREGFQLLIDPGIRRVDDADSLLASGPVDLAVGLESCGSPSELRKIVERSPSITFSLDLLNGLPRRHCDAQDWSDQPTEIIRQVVEAGVASILILDLADVGMGTGGSTDAICQWIRSTFPQLQIIAGGGVRGLRDLIRLAEQQVNAVLVASALHDGRLTRHDLKSFEQDK